MMTRMLIAIGVLFAGCKALPVYYSPQRTDHASPSNLATSDVAADSSSAGTGAAPVITVQPNGEDALLAEIRTWIGTPYAFGMISKGKGVDCSGFVGHVYNRVYGLSLPRQSADMYSQGKAIDRSELKTGDLIFLQNTYKGASGASHVGIYVGNGRMAHASTTVGVTISNLDEAYYVKHMLGYRRVLP